VDVIDFTDECKGGQGFDAPQAAESFRLTSELIRLGKALKVSIDGSLLSFKILEVFELDSQSSLKGTDKALAQTGKPLTVLFGPGRLALFEDVAMVAEDARDAMHGCGAVGVIGGAQP
jgi:hypothetical protein